MCLESRGKIATGATQPTGCLGVCHRGRPCGDERRAVVALLVLCQPLTGPSQNPQDSRSVLCSRYARYGTQRKGGTVNLEGATHPTSGPPLTQPE